jgi:hypothetical protein
MRHGTPPHQMPTWTTFCIGARADKTHYSLISGLEVVLTLSNKAPINAGSVTLLRTTRIWG